MYDLSDVDIATHTVNGKAIKYAANPANAVGFVTDAAKANDQNPHYEKDVDDPANYGVDMDNFKNGYYVEMFKDDEAAGYQGTVAKTDIDTAAEITAAVAAKQIFKIGNDYLLKVVNASEGAVTIQADLAGTVDIKGVPEIFLVCKLNGEVTGLIALSDADYGDLATLTNNATETVYTIEAYVALSDYYSATVPEIDDATSFDVLFQTIAA